MKIISPIDIDSASSVELVKFFNDNCVQANVNAVKKFTNLAAARRRCHGLVDLINSLAQAHATIEKIEAAEAAQPVVVYALSESEQRERQAKASSLSSIMDQLNASGCLFNVREESIVTETGLEIVGKKVIINESSNEAISVVSARYRTVTNEEIFQSFAQALVESCVDTTGAIVDVKFSHGGARTMVDMIFPAHEIEIDGDKSQLRITTLNSYDGSWRYVSKAGAIRLACMNGQVFGKTAAGYSSTHTPSLDVEQSAKIIANMLTQFQNSKTYWQNMLRRKVTPAEVEATIALFLGVDQETMHTKPEVKKVGALFANYKAAMGSTAYALYNAFTEYVTHKVYRPETHAHSVQFHTDRLEKTMAISPMFTV